MRVSKLESELYIRRNFAGMDGTNTSSSATVTPMSSDSDKEELFARLRSSMEQG